jgi:membrane AbrB-like protein
MRFVQLAAVSFAGGLLFTLLHIPLSWMLGPMASVMVYGIWSKQALVWPAWLRSTGLAVFGLMMGASFTIETGKQIVLQLPLMLTVTLLAIAVTIGTSWVIARQTGVSLSSSILGSIPGGLSQMVLLSDEMNDSDSTVVAFMQTIRLLSVIFIVPFIAVHGLADEVNDAIIGGGSSLLSGWGAWFGNPGLSVVTIGVAAASCWIAGKLRIPAYQFLGPLIAIILMVVSGIQVPHVPGLGIIAAQLAVGTYMGAGIRISSLNNWKKLLPYSLLGGFVVVLFCLLISFTLNKMFPISLLTAFLSTAPGGMAEMGVTAAMVHADASLVVAYQMFRVLFILFFVPPVLRWLLIRRREKSANV